jgi:hypothetical protein
VKAMRRKYLRDTGRVGKCMRQGSLASSLSRALVCRIAEHLALAVRVCCTAEAAKEVGGQLAEPMKFNDPARDLTAWMSDVDAGQ